MTNFKNISIVNPQDKFGNLRTESKTPQINLKSVYGESILRDISTTTNGGTITKTSGEYTLSTSTTTASTVELDTVERGRYQSGLASEAGLGIRLNTEAYTGTAFAQWGYYDDNDGFGFGIDATGKYVFIRRGGTTTKTYQSSWNVDVLDGTTQLTALDFTDGIIFQIDFSWYGYGQIDWQVVVEDTDGQQRPITMHRVYPLGDNSTENPNLPLRAEVDNGDTTTDYILYGGGRQFSVAGLYRPDVRETTEFRLSQGSIGTTFIPAITFRQKSGTVQSVRASGFDIITDAALMYAIYLGGTLTGESFGALTNVPTTETAVEVDTSATAISSPDMVLARGLVSSSGSGSNAIGSLSNQGLGFNIPENSTVTLAVRRISGTGATVSTVFRLTEEW